MPQKETWITCFTHSHLPPVDGNGEIKPEPEAIIDRIMKKVGHKALTEVLIK
jgi:hypothetical protein